MNSPPECDGAEVRSMHWLECGGAEVRSMHWPECGGAEVRSMHCMAGVWWGRGADHVLVGV